MIGTISDSTSSTAPCCQHIPTLFNDYVQPYLCSATICTTRSCYPESGGNHSKTAGMCTPKLFSFLSWWLTPVQPHVGGVSLVKIPAPTYLSYSSVGWEGSGEGRTGSLQGALQTAYHYLGYFRGHLGICPWPMGRVSCTGLTFLRRVGIFISAPPLSMPTREMLHLPARLA